MVNFVTKLKYLDAYPKPLDDFRIKTLTGALISTVTFFIVLILFCYEWISFISFEINQELLVDLTRHQKLTINLDITFQRLHCSLLSLDAMDISGEHQNDVIKGLKKIRIDKEGKIIKDVNEQISTTTLKISSSIIENNSLDFPKCLSCYGAESSKITCCNTCEDVKMAYRDKNWHFSPFEINQCKEALFEASRNVKASVKSEDIETIRKLIETGEGCKLQGHLEVNKVAGNFHIGN